MKTKTKRQTFVFRSTWSNHPEGQNSKGWDEEKEPPVKYFSDIYNEYLPKDAETQTPNASGYFVYSDGVKVKIEEFGNRSAPFGEYIKKVHMIFPANA